MAMGVKTGGGSRKGKPNKSTVVIREILDRCVDWDEVIGELVKLAKSNPMAMRMLLEYRFGKPREMGVNQTKDESLIPFIDVSGFG